VAINTTFTNFQTIIEADWLNNVNTIVNDIIDVKAFGATGNGVSLDTGAIQAAINSASARGGGIVFLPPGRYRTGPLNLAANVTIAGSGKYLSQIIPANNNMIIFSLINVTLARAGVTMRDFQINCGAITSIDGMQFTLCSEVDILNVMFAGCVQNFIIDRGYTHNILNCESIQTSTNKAGGCTITSTDDTDHVFYSTIWNYKIRSNEFYGPGGGLGAVNPGIQARRAVGASINMYAADLNFGGAINGIVLENDCQGCKITDCIIGASAAAVVLQQGPGPVAAPLAIAITNCDFDQPEFTAIDIALANWVTISGGFLTSSGVVTNIPAINILQASNVNIEGVTMIGFNGTGGACVDLSNAGSCSIKNCRSINNTNGIAFITNNNNTTVEGNDFINTTFPIGGAQNPDNALNVIRNNRGVVPPPISQPGVPGSSVAFANPFAHPCRVYISGGTIAGINIEGVSTGITSGHVGILNPAETISIVYSATPTWSWIPVGA